MILIIISMNIIKGNSNGIFEIIINFISLSGGGFIIGVSLINISLFLDLLQHNG